MNPAELRRIVFGFRASAALLASQRLGLLDALAGAPCEPDDLARALGADAGALRQLLGALVALGAVRQREGSFSLDPDLRGAVRAEGPDALGSLLVHDLASWDSWSSLDEAVRRGGPVPRRADGEADRERILQVVATFPAAMEQTAAGSPGRLAALLEPLRPAAVLDVGGGTGLVLAELLRLCPAASGVLIDRGFVLERAKTRLEEAGVAGRVRLVDADFEAAPLPEGFDLVLLSRILMGLPEARAQRLLQRCAEVLTPGGHLALHEYDPASLVGALLSLDMLLGPGGAVHGHERIRRWLLEAGLDLEGTARVLGYTRLWIAKRAA